MEDNGDEKICFRFLEPNEYYRLAPIMKEYKGKMPNPKLSQVAIAEIESTGELVGFFVLQLWPHAEPMWIKEEHRKSKIWLKLAAMIEPLTNRANTYIIATTIEVERMCEALGLKRVKKAVFVKEINSPLEGVER